MANESMIFYNDGDSATGFSQASRFAGKNGRVAAIPDIVEKRLRSSGGNEIWGKYFTTSTAEYFGCSKGGNQIIIVAHNIGPLATHEGVKNAYAHKAAERNEGRISKEEFLKLENGVYGHVSIIDFADIQKRYEYPFLQILTFEQACEDPLVKARLGSRAAEYLKKHLAISHKELREGDDFNNGIKEVNNFILENQCNSNKNYIYAKADNYPMAHLLGIGQIRRTHHDCIRSMVSELYVQTDGDASRFIGMRGKKIGNILPSAIDELDDLDDLLEQLEGKKKYLKEAILLSEKYDLLPDSELREFKRKYGIIEQLKK